MVTIYSRRRFTCSSLIELNEDYAFKSTPAEADRIIQERRSKLSELIESLEMEEARKFVHPIIRITDDVARETAQIAEIDRADLILVGWHVPTLAATVWEDVLVKFSATQRWM